ncbi:MAG: TldD/PmbA family protein [Candidatus Dormibacteraeota bacterium]|nr:TldD/PmbA family protein [Candidatus Dormibacteraeota bacterium]
MIAATEDVLDVAAAALQHTHRGEAEVIVSAHSDELTRFAANAIHQNVAETSLRVRARVIDDDRVGVASLGGADADELVQRVMTAAEDARRVSPATEVTPLPQPDGGPDAPTAYSEATASATPEQRADSVAIIAKRAAAQSLKAYGFVSTTRTETAIVNARGIRRRALSTRASSVVVVRGDAGSGYASRHAADVNALDIDAMASEAVDTCMRNQNADAIDPGTYEVVLGPYAVTDMLEHLGWVGLSALAVQEHRSFMRFGERVMSDSVTIRDDARDPGLFPYPFDYEGTSTRPVTLIESGVCREVVHDSATARQDGVRSTGHSLPQPNTFGPYASHLAMDAGSGSMESQIASVKRGLYVTRFWYVRDVDPLHTIITGMTRDGTFLIEDGRLGHPVRDLRFTQGIVDALDDVRGISSQRRLELGEGESGVLAPWLHLGHFAFTS